MRSLINILELSAEEIAGLIATAEDIIADPQKYAEACRGKKLATLFFEPSTRTRLSFEAAHVRTGRAGAGLFRGSLVLGIQGRERFRHREGRLLLCGHHRPCATPRRARRWWPR